MPPAGTEAPGDENRLDIIRLARPDLDQHMAPLAQMGGGAGCSRQTLAPLYRNNKIAIVANVLRSESLQLFQQFFRNPKNRYWEGSLLCRYTLFCTIFY